MHVQLLYVYLILRNKLQYQITEEQKTVQNKITSYKLLWQIHTKEVEPLFYTCTVIVKSGDILQDCDGLTTIIKVYAVPQGIFIIRLFNLLMYLYRV